jgi:two-component system sensor histidine kinase PilS (NtrC family)
MPNTPAPAGARRGAEPGPASPPADAQLPEPRWLLGWVYIGRLALVCAFVLRAVWAPEQPPQAVLTPAVLALITVAYTALAFFTSHRRFRPPSREFIYSQVVFDASLLTTIVFLTGADESIFTPLYILVIFAAALLLPILGGILVGLLTIVLYFACVWTASGELDGTVLLQLGLFAVVALVTGYLGDRLRQTGAALGEVQVELRQLQLDTGDILDTVSTGVLTVDEQGRLAYLNPAAEEILSLSARSMLGRPVLDELDRIAPGLGRVIARSARGRIAIRRFETDPIAEDSFVLGVSTTLVEREDGELPAVTAIFQDITEKKRVEALRMRSERLEAVAELSASLAHEIKNPLASIRSAVEQITGDGIDPEDGRILRDLVLRESDRLSRLLTEFIDFARVRVETPEAIDFARIVRDVAALVRAHPDCRECAIRIDVDETASRLWLRGAGDLLHRAVLNLVLNGMQWAGPGGRVDLVLDEIHSDLLSPALGSLSLIRLRVVDSGPGVPPEIVDQIFDPFFTRRPGGTGLGLALVQRAVEAHGGAIFVDNAPAGSGGGAMFTLYLPALGPEDDEAPVNPPLKETTPL